MFPAHSHESEAARRVGRAVPPRPALLTRAYLEAGRHAAGWVFARMGMRLNRLPLRQPASVLIH